MPVVASGVKNFLSFCLVAVAVAGCGGGGHSPVSGQSISVRNTGIKAGAIAYDAKRDLVYVTGASNGSVTVVSPATGYVAGTIPIKESGGELSISSDDAKLYVTQNGFIERVDLASRNVDESFYIDPTLQMYPSAPIYADVVRVQPGNSSDVATLISNSAGSQEPIWSVTLFNSGIKGNVLTWQLGVPSIYDLQYSTDGSTVYVALATGVEAFPVSGAGAGASVVQWSQPMDVPTAEARGKLYVGATEYDELTNKALGSFTVSTPTWLFAPETAADRAVAFTCAASGGSPSLAVLDTVGFKTISTYPLTGLPLVAGGGVGDLTVAGTRCAFLLTDPKTQATTLAFIDASI